MTTPGYAVMTALARDIIAHADRKVWRRNVAHAAREALAAGKDRLAVRLFCRQMREPWAAFEIVAASR